MSPEFTTGIFLVIVATVTAGPAFYSATQAKRNRKENSDQHGASKEELHKLAGQVNSLSGIVTSQGIAMLGAVDRLDRKLDAHVSDRSVHV